MFRGGSLPVRGMTFIEAPPVVQHWWCKGSTAALGKRANSAPFKPHGWDDQPQSGKTQKYDNDMSRYTGGASINVVPPTGKEAP